MKKNRAFVLICIVQVFLIIGCSGTKEDDNKLVIGVHSWPGIGPVFIGDEKGFFKEEGITIEIKTIENFDTKRASLISGQIDIDMGNTLDQLLIYRENKFDASVFLVEDFSQGGDGIVTRKDIKGLKDLTGKTISYAEASPSDFFFRYLLKANGISIDSVKIKPVADAQIAGNAILSEQVDAAVTFDPWLSQAKENANLHVLLSTKEYPNLIPGLLIASKKEINDRKDTFEKFARAWFRSVDYYYKNQENAEAIIARRMELDPRELNSILSSIHIVTKNENLKAFDTTQPDNLSELIGNINAFWKESGFVKSTFHPDDLIEKSIVE